MAANSSIRELFQPLAKRLTIIEEQRVDTYMESVTILDALSEQLMIWGQEIIPEIERYLKWITDIMAKGGGYAKYTDEFFPFDSSEAIDDRIITELKTYTAVLESFIEKVKAYGNIPNPAANNQPQVIELNGNMRVADFKGIFESKLTTQETALLLYFLQTLEYILPYTANSLGGIAVPLFAKSQQTVKTAIGDIVERNAIRGEDLRSLKKHLEELIVTIDSTYS